MCMCCGYWIKQRPAVVEPEPKPEPKSKLESVVPGPGLGFGVCRLAAGVAILLVICTGFGGCL